MVCCSEFPPVTQWVWQGGLRKPDGWSGKPDDCSRSMREMPRDMRVMPRSKREMSRSMREMPRRVKDARRMACSIVHRYYYCNHDMWPQINCKLWKNLCLSDADMLRASDNILFIHTIERAYLCWCNIHKNITQHVMCCHVCSCICMNWKLCRENSSLKNLENIKFST